jgi:hypothetical protein
MFLCVACTAPTAAPVLAPRAAAAQTAKPTSYYPLIPQIVPTGSQQPVQVNVNTPTAQPQAQSEEPAIPTLQPAASTVPIPTQPTEIYGADAATTQEYAPPLT